MVLYFAPQGYYFDELYLNRLEFYLSRKRYADVAQLVEHNLAKVGVASSNLVIRSKRAHTKPRGNMVEWLSGPKQQPAKL